MADSARVPPPPTPRSPPPAAPLDLRQRHGVETPEHVELQFELAGVGSRAAAAILDGMVIALLAALLVALLSAMVDAESLAGVWAAALIALPTAFLFFLYYILFEGLNAGRT